MVSKMNKKIEEYLFEDIPIFRKEYKSCNANEKYLYQTELDKYESIFKDKKDFFKWKVLIVRE